MCHRKHAYIIWLNITRWHFRVAVAACTASKSMEVPVYPTFLPIIGMVLCSDFKHSDGYKVMSCY